MIEYKEEGYSREREREEEAVEKSLDTKAVALLTYQNVLQLHGTVRSSMRASISILYVYECTLR